MSKKKKEDGALVEAPSTAVGAVLDETWGCEDIDPTDVLIPKLLLMQGQSDFVAQGKANVGDIVKSVDGKVVAPRGEKVTFIALNTSKSWRIMEKEGERFEWRRNEPWTSENMNRDLQWKELGNEWRADRAINFYVLLVKDIELEREALSMMSAKGDLPDGDVVLIPCQIQFLRSSYNTGKKLITEFAKAKKFRKPPASWMFDLYATQQKKDSSTYQVFEIDRAGVTTPENLAVAYEWYKTIASTEMKVHEADTEIVDDAVPPPEYKDGPEVQF